VNIHKDVSVGFVATRPNRLLIGLSHIGVVITEPASSVKPESEKSNYPIPGINQISLPLNISHVMASSCTGSKMRHDAAELKAKLGRAGVHLGASFRVVVDVVT